MVLSRPHYGYTGETNGHSSMKLLTSTMYTIFRKPDPGTLWIRSLASIEEMMPALRVTSVGSTSCKDISKRGMGYLTRETRLGT